MYQTSPLSLFYFQVLVPKFLECFLCFPYHKISLVALLSFFYCQLQTNMIILLSQIKRFLYRQIMIALKIKAKKFWFIFKYFNVSCDARLFNELFYIFQTYVSVDSK
ncbi:hypothetical protein OPV43_259 [Saccharomyces cerevisiae synthetic construct]|uniref:Putative uncharacterized membrane protein YAR047C n=1 Tax=Saccharomyces cerevisiae (strain ATCC 204508 / S288c) TaxID=559292 RepID=YAL7_YEAST|nr:RecName: Full=Putative uncharacterized membrane protein YAR047C [Saccharomyces cerevisiae S288C]AAC09498.1 Yar047cp [Saccharomyces cerevisiae]KZV13487.1 hypothetical protein WN66_00108 [Saccharomyces cerevisiae]UZT76005.1 hypothetical protein OPV43_259 [Saccharomyces cerevisiae synthetic construct]